jgi:uncharacterized repeat protein (TIGR01451 family)
LGLILSVIFIFSGAVSAATVDVEPGVGTIQDAINIANDSDTIDLSAGTYNEHDITVNKSITIKGPQITDNTAPTAKIDSQGQGRVFYIPQGFTVNLEYLTIQNGDATNNASNSYGGGILNKGNLNLQNCNITNNAAKSGGGIFNDQNAVLDVSSSDINNNYVTDVDSGLGGGIYNSGIVTFSDSNIDNNAATAGAGIYNNGKIDVFDSNIYSNTASYNGGGVFNNGFVTITDSSVYNNMATEDGYFGGGIYNDPVGTFIISDSKIYSNIAKYGGGGISNAGTFTINDHSNIYSNSATAVSGGGIYNTGAILNIIDSNIYSNTCLEAGGGIENLGTTTIDNSNIYLNTILDLDWGGGGGIDNSGILNLLGSNIYGNTAAYGGGICNEIDSVLFVNNSNIYSNAGVNGGGVCNWQGTTTLNDSNILSNKAVNGGAIYSTAGNTIINFCRIIGNNVSLSFDIISDNDDGTLNAQNNWWGSNTNPSGRVSGNVDVSTWLVLNTYASPNRITPGGISSITADLTHDQNGVYYNPINGHVPDGIDVTFTSVLGTLNPTSTLTINGVGTSVYTASMVTGTDTVKSLVDSQLVNTQINVSNPQADVGLNQSGNYSGNTVYFVVTAKNNGPDTGTNIVIKDVSPNGLTNVHVTPSVGTYSNGVWTISSLADLATATLNITGTSIPRSTTVNNATRTSQTEYNSLPNTATASVYTPLVNIEVYNFPWFYDKSTKSYQTNYGVGNSPVFSMSVYNDYDQVTGVKLAYTFGNGFSLISYDTRGIGTVTVNGNTLNWNIDRMPSGGIAFMNIVLRVIQSGSYTPNLTTDAKLVSLDPGYIDSDPTDNEMSCAITAPSSADIQVNQTVTGTPQTNQKITYTITATNNGPDTATNIQITDKIPTGLGNITITPSIGTINGNIWTIPTLTNGQTATLTITATITATQGTITNTATKTGQGSGQDDWNYNNNAQTIYLNVND